MEKEYLKDNKELMQQYNYSKNKDLNLDELTLGSKKKVWWICNKGHEWESVLYSRKNGNGCPYCSGQKVLSGFNDLLTTHPEIAKEWDYEKNGLNTPNDVSAGSSKKVWWICPNGHSYLVEVARRKLGQSCPYCKGKKVLVGFNDFESWCKQNNRYDLINEFDHKKNKFKISEITAGSGKKVWWICPDGHSYSTYLTHRTQMNTGCGICSHKVFKKNENDLLTTHPEIAKEWDYEKNKTTPDNVMAGSNNKKYWFICPKGHSYKTTLLGRKNGTNCPVCATERHTSFPEKAILYYLKQYVDDVKENYRPDFLDNNKEIDVYIPKYKLGIEYDGNAWHKNLKRDIEKDEMCEKNNIKLIRIRESKCEVYNSSAIKRIVKSGNLIDLGDAISFIFSFINDNYNLKIIPDIDIDRDRMKILELMNLYEKNNSIAVKCPEIKEYWDYEKNGIITPEQISYSSIKKVHFKCKLGHEWINEARDFLVTKNCPICLGYKVLKGFNDLFTTHPDLKKEWSKNNYLDPTELSHGSNKNVLWICSQGHEYKMKINDRVSGRGCPICSNHRLLTGFNDLETKYPEIAKEWSERNKVKPSEIFSSSRKKYYWKCNEGHEYEMTVIEKVYKKRKCPICSNRVLLSGVNDLETNNKVLSNQFDKEKNGCNPNDVIYGGTKKYWWICPKGHEYEMRIDARIRGSNCPICSSTRLLRGYNDLETINPILAKEFNITKNNDKMPYDYFPNSNAKVWWKCLECGHEWEATINNRNRGQRCPNCKSKKDD